METSGLAEEISTLLLENYGMLDADTRRSLISNLIMLRNKEVIESIECVNCVYYRCIQVHIRFSLLKYL